MRPWLALLLVAACSKDDAPADKPADGDKPSDKGDKPAVKATEADDDGARAPVLDAWKKGGLAPSALKTASVDVGKDCRTGTISDVDVLICVYDSASDAKAAHKAGLAWVGSTTGFAEPRGTFLIAAADRKKADPHGKTINQIMKLAPK